MEIDILNKKENKVLDRTEVKFDCIYSGEATPKILDVKSKLVALLNTKKDLIVVDSLQPHYGQSKASGYAKIYGSNDSLNDIETEHIIAKNNEVKAKVDEDNEVSESEEAVVDEKSSEESSEEESEEAVVEESSEESSEEESEEVVVEENSEKGSEEESEE